MKIKDFPFFDNKDYTGLNSFNLETLAFTAAQKYRKDGGKILIVLPTLYDVQLFQSHLCDFIDDDEVNLFIYDDILRIDALGSSKEMMFERIKALDVIYGQEEGVVIFNAAALLRPLISKETYLRLTKVYKLGGVFDRNEFINLMNHSGYVRKNRVEHPGEFAIRGMIIDFFSVTSQYPCRLEVDGRNIEDIRTFDPSLETSFASITQVEIKPCHDLFYDIDDKETIIGRLRQAIIGLGDYEDLRGRILRLINDINEDDHGVKVPYRHHAYFGNFRSVIDSLDSIFAYHKGDIERVARRYIEEESVYFGELQKNNLCLAKDGIYLVSALNRLSTILEDIEEYEENKITSVPYIFESLSTFPSAIKKMLTDGLNVVIFSKRERIENLLMVLEENGVDYSLFPNITRVTLVEGELSSGLLDTKRKTAYLGVKEIYGLKNKSASFLTRFKEAKIIKNYDDLVVGDYVVHELHGIGRFEGIVNKWDQDYLLILYRDDDRLYIPLVQFRLIRKYSGREGFSPSLDKMGGSTFAHRKAKIRGKIAFLADQLLEVSSKRLTEKGYSFPDGQELEHEFNNNFPYELTTSQEKAYLEIKSDMESPRPMDRLLAGDVGFGKTELAFRAAFKAILAGKQVALLCPTTILCKQHFEVASQRFKGFGVHIACFSRFINKSTQEEYIQKIKQGKINLVIGTHRLLSDEIHFSDLGLLIIDEEQRFGVSQKEKIKSIASEIDILTLTATPIPRTLQMALLGVRELSNLDEPPLNRLPIKTYVTHMDSGLVKEAISLELGRTGQVYYLHNKVKTIYSKAAELKKLFPEARIGVAHGKMTPVEMADVMNSFYDGEIDILVCTTIIETGLDVANVNTIIVESASNFGLAQLYQIKGRVGRSDRLAYAYFFYDDKKEMTEESQKRLKALKEFTELGSGYNIAKQDLNIRGAGNILGAEQAGYMDSLGFDNYQALLDEVIRQKTFKTSAIESEKIKTYYVLSFSLDSIIPNEYAEDNNRITIYRELANIETERELYIFKKKVRDVYGPYKEEVGNLFVKKSVEIKLSQHYVRSFVEGIDYYEIMLTREAIATPSFGPHIESDLESLHGVLRINYRDGCLVFRLLKTRDYLDNLSLILDSIENNIKK